ncbi:CBS domain-containing protein [Flavobacteriaceae bacterium Ap0902]|nr:CBS domain-containing protein [Flavobacteriaceae bacterium Ap0902]
MLIQDLITAEFAPVTLQSSVQDALDIVDGFKISHIPVFEGLTFIGNMSDLNLKERPLEETLSDNKMNVEKFFLNENNTIFDAVRIFYRNESNLIPVLDDHDKYLGYITADEIMGELSRMPFLSELSAMITVKVPTKQFSMSEVAKIVESNNGRILGCFISGFSDDMTEITVRFNAESLSSVVATFERFGYLIKYQFFNDDKADLLQDRFKQLIKFIDV